jgi:aminoglycoside phosphotransferase (APT) family kinase protein
MLPILYDQFVERYRDDLDPGVVETVTRLRSAIGGAEPPRPYTVVHSDFRADNLVFEGGGGRVPIATVDWQTVTYGVAATDLAFVIGTSLGRDERREHEAALVERYHRALLDGGVTGYDAERCWADYRRWACYGVMFLVPSTVLVERTERGDAMFLTAITRAHEQMADLGTLALLGV